MVVLCEHFKNGLLESATRALKRSRHGSVLLAVVEINSVKCGDTPRVRCITRVLDNMLLTNMLTGVQCGT